MFFEAPLPSDFSPWMKASLVKLEHLEKPEETIKKLKTKYIFCNPDEVKYDLYFPQHISKFDISKKFEHVDGYLWKSKIA